LPLRGEARLPGPPAIELALDVFFLEPNSRRTAVDHAADSGPVTFAEAGEPEKVTESIE
jgi:hypothetical protein